MREKDGGNMYLPSPEMGHLAGRTGFGGFGGGVDHELSFGLCVGHMNLEFRGEIYAKLKP